MYMHAVLSWPLQPSHFSVRTKVGMALLLSVFLVSSMARLAGRVAHELHLHFFLEPRVVLAQDREHLGAAEFRGHRVALREPLAQLRAGDEQPLGVAVGAGSPRGHAA